MPVTQHLMKTSNLTIPDRSLPGSTRTAPSAGHQDGGVKCATSKIRGRDNITIGTWNTRTLRAAGKLQELTHEMDRYRFNILGLCEMRWKNFGETTTEEGHKVFFSGKEDKHEHGVGFLVHKDIVNTVMGCRPVSSRLFTIRLRAVPFNITIVQAYTPTSDYDDNKTEDFYDQPQNVIDQTPKDILVVQGVWNAKVGRMLVETGKAFVDLSEMMTQMREDSDFWSLPPLTTLCWRTHLVTTKHAEDGHGIAQIDNTTTRLIIF